MSPIQDYLYMPRPEDTILGKAESLFRLLQYRVWRRELMRFVAKDRTFRFRIIDVGCGPGFLLRCLSRWFQRAELVGVDQSEALLQIAQSRCAGMTGFKGDACALPFSAGYADAAFALHVVEHLSEPSLFFGEAHRVVRPGGMLIIATPNPEGASARLMGRSWKGRSDPTHVSLHGACYWTGMLERSGFKIERQGTTGLAGLPLLNKMPLGLIHWIPSFFFGFFPWNLGEAFICVATRRGDEEFNGE